MAALSFTQMRTRQNRRLKDSNDITFTSSEKDEFLETAIADPYVFDIARDTTITTRTSSGKTLKIKSPNIKKPVSKRLVFLL
jgi:hypothetical protein